MKSIIQEGSSIIKAIHDGWERAGKPQEFSIKVFEEEEKNFIGFTKKPAKIAIFFTEEVASLKDKKVYSPVKQQLKQIEKVKQKIEPKREGVIAKKKSEVQGQENIKKIFWKEDLIKAAEKWVQDLLIAMNITNATFNTHAQQLHLKFNFETPFITDEKKQKEFFRSAAHILMYTLRYRFKTPLRNFKVIFSISTK